MIYSIKERKNIPDSKFAYINGDLKLFPILEESDAVYAETLLEKIKFSAEEKAQIKEKINVLKAELTAKNSLENTLEETVKTFNFSEGAEIAVKDGNSIYTFTLKNIS